jgi:hypothetical protein
MLGAFSLGVKWQGYEADHPSPSVSKVKKDGATSPLSHISTGHSAYLIEHCNSFTLYLCTK